MVKQYTFFSSLFFTISVNLILYLQHSSVLSKSYQIKVKMSPTGRTGVKLQIRRTMDSQRLMSHKYCVANLNSLTNWILCRVHRWLWPVLVTLMIAKHSELWPGLTGWKILGILLIYIYWITFLGSREKLKIWYRWLSLWRLSKFEVSGLRCKVNFL